MKRLLLSALLAGGVLSVGLVHAQPAAAGPVIWKDGNHLCINKPTTEQRSFLDSMKVNIKGAPSSVPLFLALDNKSLNPNMCWVANPQVFNKEIIFANGDDAKRAEAVFRQSKNIEFRPRDVVSAEGGQAGQAPQDGRVVYTIRLEH